MEELIPGMMMKLDRKEVQNEDIYGHLRSIRSKGNSSCL